MSTQIDGEERKVFFVVEQQLLNTDGMKKMLVGKL